MGLALSSYSAHFHPLNRRLYAHFHLLLLLSQSQRGVVCPLRSSISSSKYQVYPCSALFLFFSQKGRLAWNTCDAAVLLLHTTRAKNKLSAVIFLVLSIELHNIFFLLFATIRFLFFSGSSGSSLRCTLIRLSCQRWKGTLKRYLMMKWKRKSGIINIVIVPLISHEVLSVYK